jgi:hypothetical protein
MLHAVQRLQDLIHHIWSSTCPGGGEIYGLSTLWQLGLDKTLRKTNDYCLPFHGRCNLHAASHSRQVRYRAESVCEVALIFRHVLPLHDEAHLEPLNFSLCSPAECRLIL